MHGSVAIDHVKAERLQYAAIQQNVLLIWTVYERPADYPDLFVARPSRTEAGEVRNLAVHLEALTLDGVRKLLPGGLYRMDRHPTDEPQILETWF